MSLHICRRNLQCFILWNLLLFLISSASDDDQHPQANSADASLQLYLTRELQEMRQFESSLLLALQETRQRLQVLENRLSDLHNHESSLTSRPEGNFFDLQSSASSVLGIQRQLFEPQISLAPSNHRLLASSSSSKGSKSGGGGGEHAHQHDALVYLIVVLIIGTGILHLSTLEYFHSLPYTVVLFVLGVLCSVFYQFFVKDEPDNFGIFARSYEMWMDIDPHLLIFTMLPVLLTGDAMTLDTSIAKRVSSQCLWLAGPGVLLGAFGTATFLWVYLKWDFLLCLACGSILSATDPVAVVGLLKELGASQTLTVQIQGESLLNDGTAMVLFKVAYSMLEGEEHTVKSILIMMLYMVGCSWFLGLVIGGLFSSWIKAAGKRLEHNSDMIQISLTMCAAYGSFVISEGIIGINGVLSTVAAALVLADTIWVKIVNKTAMLEVWHTLEYVGNTLIFFLAGALGGRSLWLIDLIDVFHLLVIYIVLVLMRTLIMFGSRPILKCLSPDHTPVSAADAAVMTWGGLRGAVGLALSIQLMRDRAGGNIDDADANKVFFFTAGIAFLTLIINATTCPKLVSWLGITRCPESKNSVLRDVVQRLLEKCEDEEEGPAKRDSVRVLQSVMHHLHTAEVSAHEKTSCKSGSEVVEEFMKVKTMFLSVPARDKSKLGWHDGDPLLRQEANLIELTLSETADSSMVQTINESFLALVRHELWAQIQQGEFVEGTRSAEILLNSNTKALEHASSGLTDLAEIENQFGVHVHFEEDEITNGVGPRRVSGWSLKHSEDGRSLRGMTRELIKSVHFQAFIIIVILFNAVVIFTDPGSGSDSSLIYLLLECIFVAVYLFEFAVKYMAMRAAYFRDGWNALDFMCMVLGLFGIITSALVEADVLSSVAISSEMLLIRLGRVFKMLRIVRIISLVQFLRKLRARLRKEKVSGDLAVHLERIFTLRGFVRAHLQSHKKFLRYFGAQTQRCACGNKLMVDSIFCRKCGSKCPEHMIAAAITGREHARCILESWTALFRGIILGSLEIELVDAHGDWILEGLSGLKESSAMATRMGDFVLSAADDCVILSKDAETIIHPIYDHLRQTEALFADTHQGIHRHSLRDSAAQHLNGDKQSPAGEVVEGVPEVITAERSSADKPMLACEEVDIDCGSPRNVARDCQREEWLAERQDDSIDGLFNESTEVDIDTGTPLATPRAAMEKKRFVARSSDLNGKQLFSEIREDSLDQHPSAQCHSPGIALHSLKGHGLQDDSVDLYAM